MEQDDLTTLLLSEAIEGLANFILQRIDRERGQLILSPFLFTFLHGFWPSLVHNPLSYIPLRFPNFLPYPLHNTLPLPPPNLFYY